MPAIFKKKSEQERRSIRYPILLNQKEAEQIRNAANERQLSVADFLRRTALGRKAEVNHNTELVLALLQLDRSINVIGQRINQRHDAMVERGLNPATSEVDDWREVKTAIKMAVGRIAESESNAKAKNFSS